MSGAPDAGQPPQRRTVLAAAPATTAKATPRPTTVTTDASARRVETSGDYVELLAVPWGTFTVADRGPDGAVTVFREVWDDRSVRVPTRPLRLALHHDVTHLAGVLTRWESRPDGLYAYGKLSGSRQDKERVRAYVADGLTQEVSVGFIGSEDDEWSPPPTGTRNTLASVRRVGVPLREVSLVNRAALDGARVLRLSDEDPAQAALRARRAQVLAEAEEAIRGPVGSRQRFAHDAHAEHQQALADRAAERRRQVLAEAAAFEPTDRMAARLSPPPPPSSPVVVGPWDGVTDHEVLARQRQALEVYQMTAGRDLSAWCRYTEAMAEASRRGLE
ncbi:hypothetical protein [Isoptericola sp. NPDC019482]|uniref:hypothetical protein n=1 Tax=Isoptericola sp. NPDC019482 TaxID=3154688 RepID=UPI00346A640A